MFFFAKIKASSTACLIGGKLISFGNSFSNFAVSRKLLLLPAFNVLSCSSKLKFSYLKSGSICLMYKSKLISILPIEYIQN